MYNPSTFGPIEIPHRGIAMRLPGFALAILFFSAPMFSASSGSLNYKLVGSSGDVITFQIPSATPTAQPCLAHPPECFGVSSVTVNIDGKSIPGLEIEFFASGEFGGIGIEMGNESPEYVNTGGPLLFSGSLQSPTLTTGSFPLSTDTCCGAVYTDATWTLTVSNSGCQVEVPNAWGQAGSPWGPLTYDLYNVGLCQSHPPTAGECKIGDSNSCCRMKTLGCTTTSLAMALSAAGVSDLPDPLTTISVLDPGSLNTFMDLHADYDGNHDVQIETATLDVNLFTLGLRGGNAIHFDDTLRGDKDPNDLKNAVCSGHPVIVTVAPIAQCSIQPGPPGGHYVLVKGTRTDSVGTHFDIVDPGCRANNTLDLYGNDFVIRGFIADPGDVSTLEFETDDAADLLITDPTGNRTGFDPTASLVKKEIPQSSYGQDFLTDNDTGEAGGITHSVNVFQPAQGDYNVVVNGLKSGTYSLSVASFSSDGSKNPSSLMGIAGNGSSSAFQVDFSSSPGGATRLTRLATFQSVLDDISNGLQLGLIDNQGIANSFSKKLLAAQGASVLTRNSILTAFKNEVIAQSGKHVNGIASKVLIEDADSLIEQNP
jgi:hypothetical protein